MNTLRLSALILAATAGSALAQPANNNCVNAIPVTVGTISFSTVGATTDGTGCAANQDIWYSFVATANGTHTLTTCGQASFDTYIAVYSGTGCAPLGTQLACVDDTCGLQTQVTFIAAAGQSYLLRIGGYGGSTGTGNFSLSVGGPAPVNNGCSAATSVVESGYAFDNTAATTDGPADASGITNDIWYRYNCSFTGTVNVNTCAGTSFDTAIAVYQPSTCPVSVAPLVFNNDFCGTGSQVTFAGTAGQSYLIRVGSAGAGVGTGLVRISNSGAPPSSAGPDVILSDFTSITNWTSSASVGGVRGYSIDSYTCNIGDTNLLWGNSQNGTPALGMNMYKLKNGRLEQIGLSFVKYSCCAAAGNGCGLACNGTGGSLLGAGCLDVYGSGYNGSQSLLGPRSSINPLTGLMTRAPGSSGDAIFRRLQVAEADMSDTSALYFVEGVYVGSDDAAAGNTANNCTYRNVTVSGANYTVTPTGTTFARIPAINAWRDHGNGIGSPDNSVTLVPFTVPNEGRFVAGVRVSPAGANLWDYEYAVMNISSYASGGQFRVPVPTGAVISNIGFKDVNYHSGEIYDSTDWTGARVGNEVVWNPPQTFAQNASGNAIRWGTMYNFRFRASVPPAAGNVTLGMFRPHTPQSVTVALSVPGGCRADFNGVDGVTVQDIFDFLAVWNAGLPEADFNGVGGVTVQDIFDFLTAWNAGCN